MIKSFFRRIPLGWRWGIAFSVVLMAAIGWLFRPIFFPTPPVATLPLRTVTVRGILPEEQLLMHYQPAWIQHRWARWGRPPLLWAPSNHVYYFVLYPALDNSGASAVVLNVYPPFWPSQPITGQTLILHIPGPY